MRNVLYIHGMGGGSDSRIPSILQKEFSETDVNIVVRTYDFDPDVASEQIAGWVSELKPELVIGESLGSLHALRISGVPHVFVSPALNAPIYFELLAWLTLIPGISALVDRIYRPREGDRQSLHFSFATLRKYRRHRRLAMQNTPLRGSTDTFHAFFGTADHYRKSGIVSLRTWHKYFGDTYSIYEGTHFMEDEYVCGELTSVIVKILEINK